MSNVALTELETRAAQLGYHYDGLVRVGEPAIWTIVLIDTAGSELTFQGETIEQVVELATDRMALPSGMIDL